MLSGGKMNISDQMGSVYDRDTFIEFLNSLANDFEKKPQEWENMTISLFLQSVAAWIEDWGDKYGNDEFDKLDYHVLAKIFYMGKTYE